MKKNALSFVVVVMILMIASCSTLEKQTNFPAFRHSTKSFENMNYLGVTEAKGIAVKDIRYLLRKIKKCGQYTKTNRLKIQIALKEGDGSEVLKGVRESLKKYQASRYIHGALVINLAMDKASQRNDNVTLVSTKSSGRYKWIDSYGNAINPVNSLYGLQEIGEDVKFLETPRVMKSTTRELGIRFLLYNKAKDKLVLDKLSALKFTIKTYSKKPMLTDAKMKKYFTRHLMDRVSRSACPSIADVSRTLYAQGTESKGDLLNQKGIDFWGDEEFDKAADMWRQSVLFDKKSAFAHHNLGVYYERQGRISAAMEEYKKAKYGRRVMDRPPVQFDDTLDLVRPKSLPDELEPRVYSVSGANWVTILGGRPGALKIGKVYSIYRSRLVNNYFKYSVEGIELTEVGKVRIIKNDSPYVLAKMLQFLKVYRIEPGDVIMLSR